MDSQIIPAYQILKNTDIINLQIEPHDNTIINQKQKQIRCQNGSNECKANTFMQCTISTYPKAQEFLPVLGCSFKSLFNSETNANELVEKVFAACATKNGVDYKPIEVCYHMDKKLDELQTKPSSIYTPVNRSCYPHVKVNNKRIDITKRSLVEEICDAIDSDDTPRRCNRNNMRSRR